MLQLYKLSQLNFFDLAGYVAVATKPALSGYGIMAAIATYFNIKTMNNDCKPCHGGTVFKNSTVKMGFKFEV